MTTDYSDFRVLIDDAAASPELGFSDYASALGDIIKNSTPEFAVGIFGSWGTGKTTLMRQIERLLDEDPAIVTAWFTAWRYEKEPHLIVPLIDVLRESLDRKAALEVEPGPARRAAGQLRKAGRAFLAGLTLSASMPGVAVRLDPGKVMNELRANQDDGDEALSFYHAAFLMLREAIEDFSDEGKRRVVIFVDDLDRCLPSNALEVLESMKLFFDVQGCVFVVGLDQAVAERAVAQKYAVDATATTEQTPVSGVDYLKKIFQVPFALPRIGTDQLQGYCHAMLHGARLAPAQIEDFNHNVSRHLAFLPEQDSVNPREIKRLINAYVLQVKMLRLRLGPSLDPNMVLVLQILSFRTDWRDFYEGLAADPMLFQRTVRAAVESDQPPEQIWMNGRSLALPARLLQYLRGPGSAVLQNPQLASYVSAAESTRSSDPSLLDAQAALNRLRALLQSVADDGAVAAGQHDLLTDVSRLLELAHRRTDQPHLMRAVRDMEVLAKELSSPAALPEQLRAQRIERFGTLIAAAETELRELRRQSNLGAYA